MSSQGYCLEAVTRLQRNHEGSEMIPLIEKPEILAQGRPRPEFLKAVLCKQKQRTPEILHEVPLSLSTYDMKPHEARKE